MNRVRQVLLTGAPVLVAVLGAWMHRWVTEDAFIVVRVADQIAAGNGPVFNVAERAEAATSTLWLAVVTLLRVTLGRVAAIEWLMVVVGIGLTAFALVAAQLGAGALERARGRDGLSVPVGVWVLALLPPMWDFASSGLETGLVFAWLGGCWWALSVRAERVTVNDGFADRAAPFRPWWLCVLVGLGPLVRPDLALFSVAFFLALCAVSAPGWRGRLRAAALALALPVVVEVFRMGYYGALVPTTALAKSAGRANWGQGWTYLADFATPYWVVVPLVVLGATVGIRHWSEPGRTSVPARAVTAAMLVAAGLSTLYVLRLGGDFMHARFALPAFFAALAPVAALRVCATRPRAAWIVATGAVLVVVWGVAASRVVLPYAGSIDASGITDERRWWEMITDRSNPVTLADYDTSILAERARSMRDTARTIGPDALVIDEEEVQTSMPGAPGSGTVLSFPNIGVFGMDVGLDTHVHDWHGLSDPVAARVGTADAAGRPGHEKELPAVWAIARYGAPRADDPPEVLAARRALGCGELAEVLAATTEPMSAGRFLRNVRRAAALGRVEVPADPFEAERRFCGDGSDG